MLLYALAVTAGCVLFARPMLRLFTTDGDAIAYGALLLSRQAIVYAFTAMKHFQEASLRGRQQMGLYLASNLGGTAIDLLACGLLVPLCGYSGFYLALSSARRPAFCWRRCWSAPGPGRPRAEYFLFAPC